MDIVKLKKFIFQRKKLQNLDNKARIQTVRQETIYNIKVEEFE